MGESLVPVCFLDEIASRRIVLGIWTTLRAIARQEVEKV